MKPPLSIRLTIAAATIAGALVALKSCSKPPTPDPKDDPRLLVVDGLTITFEELQPYVDWIRSFRPEGGTKTIHKKVLADHVLPLRLAQRAFADEREEQRKLAQGLADVAENIYDLERLTENSTRTQRKKLARMQARLPVSMFVFDPLRTGAVSQPIELPQGWFVVGSYEMVESQIVTGDLCDVLQVAFVTHNAEQWALWFDAERERIKDKVTFVHPDYRDDLPAWLEPPKTPKKP